MLLWAWTLDWSVGQAVSTLLA